MGDSPNVHWGGKWETALKGLNKIAQGKRSATLGKEATPILRYPEGVI